MGCARQIQFCNPRLPPSTDPAARCIPLGSMRFDEQAVLKLWSTEDERRMINTVMDVLENVILTDSVLNVLGVSALTARYKLQQGVQGPIPDDQWQLEVKHWQATSLAALQALYVEFASRPSNPDVLQFLERPGTPELLRLCESQVRNNVQKRNPCSFWFEWEEINKLTRSLGYLESSQCRVHILQHPWPCHHLDCWCRGNGCRAHSCAYCSSVPAMAQYQSIYLSRMANERYTPASAASSRGARLWHMV